MSERQQQLQEQVRKWSPRSVELTFVEQGVEAMVSLYDDGMFHVTVGGACYGIDRGADGRWIIERDGRDVIAP